MNILHISPTFESKTCGIGIYSRNLYDGIKAVDQNINQVVLNGFATVYGAIYDQNPDIVHIQLEYGFCSPQRLILIDSLCYDRKIPLFITFHTLAPAPHNQAARRAVKLSHTTLSKEYGNFEVIPMGIPSLDNLTNNKLSEKLLPSEADFLRERIFPHNPFLFFGQAHSHKQLLEVLNFVKGKDHRLVCVVSKPIQGDLTYFSKCYDLAKSLSNVCWIENFLTELEVINVSCYCKTAIFPYSEYGSIGVSAAVKLLLLNPGINIYTSETSHFSDIPNEIGVINKFERMEDMFEDLGITHDPQMRKTWVRENSFAEVAKLHIELYKQKRK